MMICLNHKSELFIKGKQNVNFEVVNLDELHGLLSLLDQNEDELFDKIRQFYEICPEKELQLNLHLKNIPQNLDFEWERRIKHSYRYMLELEKLMWNLSTLGGAYSAMGDFDTKFAETAAKISEHQIMLAKKFGDPTILARCYLYTALAEAQMGRVSHAVKIVKLIKHWTKSNPNSDLVSRCCDGVYQKIKAIHLLGICNQTS